MVNAIEQGILQYIQNCRVEDLRSMVKSNLSLKTMILEIVPLHMIEIAKSLASNYNASSLSARDVLTYVSQTRPDLAEVLNTSEGRMWLKNQLREIQEAL